MESSLVYEEVYSAPVAQVWGALNYERPMSEWYFPQLISIHII